MLIIQMVNTLRLRFVEFLSINTHASMNIRIITDSKTKGIAITALKLGVPSEKRSKKLLL